MANIKSAIKRIRSTKRKTARNKMVRSKIATLTKKVSVKIKNKDDEGATKSLKEAIVALDKAAQKNIIHKNTAARKKSRLVKKLNQAQENKTVHEVKKATRKTKKSKK